MFNLFSIGDYPPTVQNPPHSNSYAFPLRSLTEPSSGEIEGAERKIGSKINAAYTNGTKMTPTQLKRLIAISATALCTILAVGAIIAACTVAWPIGLAAVVLVGVAIGCAIYAATREDFDSPERREKIMQSIAQKSLQQIARDYNRDDIVGYALLDRTIVRSNAAPEIRAAAYARFEKLADEFQRAGTWTEATKGDVRAIYGAATRTFKNWYHDQKARLADARHIREQRHEIDRLRHANQGCHKPTTGERVLGAIQNGLEVWTEFQEREIEMKLERQYGAAITPWDGWLNGEEARIQGSYNNAVGALEERFAILKR